MKSMHFLMLVVALAPLASCCDEPCCAQDANRPVVEAQLERNAKLLDDALGDLRGLNTYRCAKVIRACELAQLVGQEKAFERLLSYAKKDRDNALGVAVLCRVLYARKGSAEFRAAMLGRPSLLGGTDSVNWPLEPIELVDGVPFLIIRGYSLRGHAETGESYLRYCHSKCEWSNRPITEKSQEELERACNKLIRSAKWRENLDDRDDAFLRSQVAR